MIFTLHRATAKSEWLSIFIDGKHVSETRASDDPASDILKLYVAALKHVDNWTEPTSEAEALRLLKKEGYFIGRTETSKYTDGKLRDFSFDLQPL